MKIIKQQNRGFTLAELLVTLGIISFVSILTVPVLVQSVGNAKVGPTLMKAKTSYENAVGKLLADRAVPGITDIARINSHKEVDENGKEVEKFDTGLVRTFVVDLQQYIKGSYNEEIYPVKSRTGDNEIINKTGEYNQTYLRLDTEDGITYWVNIWTSQEEPIGFPNIPSNQFCGQVFIDINGEKGPNRESKDIFNFWAYNDGTLRPNGSEHALRTSAVPANKIFSWKNGNCDKSKISMPATCSGSIFENNLKVI